MKSFTNLILAAVLGAATLAAQSVGQTTYWPLTGYDSGSTTPSACTPPSFFYNTVTKTLSACGGNTFSAPSAAVVATATASGQSANINATNLYTVPAGSTAYVRACGSVTLASAGGATGYTLPTAGLVVTQNGVIVLAQLGALGAQQSGCTQVAVDAGTTIQYQVANYSAGTGGKPTYNVKIRLESLGN